MAETKNKNWFRRHWILTIFLTLIALGAISSIFNEKNSEITGNVVYENQKTAQEEIIDQHQEPIEICNPNWQCGEWSECSSSDIQIRTCVDSNNCGSNKNKPLESQSCVYKKGQESDLEVEEETKQNEESYSLDDWEEDLKKAMEELEEVTKEWGEQSNIYNKIDECTKLCAGEDIDIPVIKSECYSSCYQIYYYAGEEALDEYIEELKA